MCKRSECVRGRRCIRRDGGSAPIALLKCSMRTSVFFTSEEYTSEATMGQNGTWEHQERDARQCKRSAQESRPNRSPSARQDGCERPCVKRALRATVTKAFEPGDSAEHAGLATRHWHQRAVNQTPKATCCLCKQMAVRLMCTLDGSTHAPWFPAPGLSPMPVRSCLCRVHLCM